MVFASWVSASSWSTFLAVALTNLRIWLAVALMTLDNHATWILSTRSSTKFPSANKLKFTTIYICYQNLAHTLHRKLLWPKPRCSVIIYALKTIYFVDFILFVFSYKHFHQFFVYVNPINTSKYQCCKDVYVHTNNSSCNNYCFTFI